MSRLTLNLDRPFNGVKPDLGYMLQLVPASWKPEVNDFIEISVKGFMTQEYRIEDLLYINPEFLLHDQEMILKSIFGFDIKWILKYLKETYKEDRYYIIGCRSVVRISSPIIVGEDHGIQSIIPIMMSQNRRIIEHIKEKKIKEAQKMKQVIYGKDWNQTYIADQGEYKGVKYFIVAGGIHPCAYVMCDESFVEKHKDKWGDLDCIHVHGGVTWCEDVSHLKTHPKEYEGMCFGWDYGHLGDWAGYWGNEDNMMSCNRKWTTEEILDECHYAIDQYLEAMEKERV